MSQNAAASVVTVTSTITQTATSTATHATTSATTSATSQMAPEGTLLNLKVSITASSQIPVKLARTSKDFQQIIAKEYRAISADCTMTVSVDVDSYYSDSFASGGANGCGGAAAMWFRGVNDGKWHTYYYQSVDFCSHIASLGMPKPPVGFSLPCTSNGKTINYRGPGTS